MEGLEVRKLAALEGTHWWYAERRHLLDRQLKRLTPGRALDIGAAGGGNTRVLQARGWQALALEYTPEGAQVASERGLAVVRADATALPVADASLDAVVAYDVLEHIPDDHGAVTEIRRALRPGGQLLVAVPVDMRLWSEHDVAVGSTHGWCCCALPSPCAAGARPAATCGTRLGWSTPPLVPWCGWNVYSRWVGCRESRCCCLLTVPIGRERVVGHVVGRAACRVVE